MKLHEHYYDWQYKKLSDIKCPPTEDKRKVVVPTTFLGIEIEAEHFQGFSPSFQVEVNKFWGQRAEGSLREYGVEWASKPIRGDTVVSALQVLDQMNATGLTYNARTGLHVHINCIDMDLDSIRTLCALYVLFEPALYAISGSRESSPFCIESRGGLDGIPEILAGNFNRGINQSQKYSGFNLKPLKTFGTVEFRQAQGTSNTTVILDWCNILLRIHEFARKHPYNEIKPTLWELNTTSQYSMFAMQVFQEQVWYFPNPDWKNIMEEGVAYLKECDITSHMHNPKILDGPLLKKPKERKNNKPQVKHMDELFKEFMEQKLDIGRR